MKYIRTIAALLWLTALLTVGEAAPNKGPQALPKNVKIEDGKVYITLPITLGDYPPLKQHKVSTIIKAADGTIIELKAAQSDPYPDPGYYHTLVMTLEDWKALQYDSKLQ